MTIPVEWTTALALNLAPDEYLCGDCVAVYCDTKPDGNNVCIFSDTHDVPAMKKYLESEYAEKYTVTVVPLAEKPKHYQAMFTPKR